MVFIEPMNAITNEKGGYDGVHILNERRHEWKRGLRWCSYPE